jgi:CDP-diacylglycerol---serine O-phosphatidyltransferase
MPIVERRRQRLKGLHINRMIPNVLTLLALAAGLSALRFSLQEHWEHSVLAILVAAVLDGLDGRIARILKGASRFGAELDSLSDFLCFGVAPAFTLYLWALVHAGRIGWALVLLLCICCALRLARFNTNTDEDEAPAWNRNFFVGMPTPAGAGLALFPLVLWFQTDWEFLRHPLIVGIFMLATSLLLVSRVRTFTFKKIRVAQSWVLPAMLGVGLYLALLFSAPWIMLTLTLAAYIASIPFSVRLYNRSRRSSPAPEPSTATPETSAAPPA